MPTLHQYDYIFAIGTIFAFLDAWNIGANDVANSWANTVASRSLSYIQAMIIASAMEFAGAVGVGSRVADTIRTKIVKTSEYEDSPGVLMLGMVCAVTASSIFLTFATKFGFPVSTTHSILGGVLGMGIASLGSDGISWVGDKSKGGTSVIKDGVVQVFLAWLIAPILSGFFGAAIFLITKYAVLVRQNSVMKGLMLVPVYFGFTGALLIMLLIWKGGKYEVNLQGAEIPGVIIGGGALFGLLVGIFLVPWLYRVVVKEDWQLRWYHIFLGPLLLKRGEVPPPPAEFTGVVRNYYEGHLTKEELAAKRAGQAVRTDDIEASGAAASEKKVANSDTSEADANENTGPAPPKSLVGPKPEGKVLSGPVLFWYLKYCLLRGVDRDVVTSQKEKSVIGGDVEELHSRARHFDNKTEFLYTFMQVLSASTSSFVHGANDVANAIGPYATVYQVWKSGIVPEKSSQVPDWVLVFGGAGIVIGLWTYGYNIMRNLGNRLTLQSPSRGFANSLGSVITIILATQLKLPISTTQCITGSTVGVGLCNGDFRAINWRMVTWIYLGWFITLPCAGIISGCLMGIVINAPRFGISP